MFRKVTFSLALWCISLLAHAQFTDVQTQSFFQEAMPVLAAFSPESANENDNSGTPLPWAPKAGIKVPLDVLQSISKWETTKNGKMISYSGWYANGAKALSINMLKEKLHGQWQTWYKNGHLRDEGAFVHNMPHGEWKSWYPNGKLRSMRQYNAHKMQMVAIAMRQRNPKLAFHAISQQAINHPQKINQLLSPTFAIAGSGTNAQYEYPFRQCFHHGFYANYYENGTMQQTGFFKDGLKDGLWLQWNENGEPLSSAHYQLGLLHGAKKEFSVSGMLQKMTEYNHGKKVFEKTYAL